MKLTIELVPQTCWFSNVRAVVSKKQWDTIKAKVAAEAYHCCRICGGIGPKHPVECHEIWHYDDKKLIQRLEGMIALCPNCHMVKHMGLAQIQNKGEEAVRHLMKINKLTRDKAEKYIEEVFEIWGRRSTKKWTLNINHLKEYGINTNNIKHNANSKQ